MLTLKDESQLTEREIKILQLLADGCSNKQIAKELGISIRTVKFHTNNIYSKLDVDSRSQAIAWAWKNGQPQNLSED